MLKIKSYVLISLLGLATMLWYGCKKDESKPATAPTGVSTTTSSNISASGATITGTITGDGGSSLLSVGVAYSTTNTTPTVDDKMVAAGSNVVGAFTVSLTGLDDGTRYYARAFASNAKGFTYGNVLEFTTITLPLPTLTTADVDASSITDTSATGGGNNINDMGSTVTERGLCWSATNSSPTIVADSKKAFGAGAGSFSGTFGGLTPNTTYNVRAYATNANGTGYGSTIVFTTRPGRPDVTFGAITNIANTAADLSAQVVADNGASVTERGFCYSTSPNPTTSSATITSGSGSGSFTGSISFLGYGTTYYVRAYAINSTGIGYSNQGIFTTTGVEDRDGNTYNTIKIGSQTWMAENLRVRKLNDGTNMLYPASAGSWVSYADNTPCYAYVDESLGTAATYGLLYNYKAVESGKLCPVGWHVPSSAEFNSLESFIGGPGNGQKLRATFNWQSFSGISATNSTGFSAMPTGWRDSFGNYYDFLKQTHFRTTTPSSSTTGAHNMRFLYYNSDNFPERGDFLDVDGASVRCIKN